MIKDNNSITLTIVTNMTANYSESLGNISAIQKTIQSGKTYGKRSKESLKHAIIRIIKKKSTSFEVLKI